MSIADSRVMHTDMAVTAGCDTLAIVFIRLAILPSIAALCFDNDSMPHYGCPYKNHNQYYYLGVSCAYHAAYIFKIIR